VHVAGGLVGLLDDVAALAKLAAASVDDVSAAAGKASVKAAGVVVDDTAVTPAYVRGLAAERELPIIKRIAVGSLRNKVLFILPAALLLSSIAPKLVEVILMCGGAFLCYEGAHKIIHALKHDDHEHDVPAAAQGVDAEEATVAGAIRTDFILSAEIMVISLKEVIHEPVVSRAVILAVVAVLITAVVYGVVALIVKMDDVGLAMAERDSASSQRVGRALVAGMPRLLAGLSTVGTAAMLWVGGHILLVGAHELGWHSPYDLVHDLEHHMPHGSLHGVLAWLVNTAASAAVGLAVGLVVATVVARLSMGKGEPAAASHAEPAADAADPAGSTGH
jgi:predicted DNA repair protein MutK